MAEVFVIADIFQADHNESVPYRLAVLETLLGRIRNISNIKLNNKCVCDVLSYSV